MPAAPQYYNPSTCHVESHQCSLISSSRTDDRLLLERLHASKRHYATVNLSKWVHVCRTLASIKKRSATNTASQEAADTATTSDLQPSSNKRDQVAEASHPQASTAGPYTSCNTRLPAAAAEALPPTPPRAKPAAKAKATPAAAAAAAAQAAAQAAMMEDAGPLGSEPCLELERISAFTGELLCRGMCYLSMGGQRSLT